MRFSLRILCAGLSTAVFGLAAGLLPAGQNPAPSPPGAAVAVGLKASLESKMLQETREVWIRLPDGYDGSSDRYPVLIQLGGGPHFLYTAAVVELLARNAHIPEMIVAALPEPTPRHHYRDSTPTRVDYLPAGGGAPDFLRFLTEELIPWLQANYRVQPFRILCGHGLSGLFAVYALLESPGTFGGIITDGASLTFDNSMILPVAEGKTSVAGIRGLLYLGVGNERETIPGLLAFTRLLEKKAFSGLEWKMEIEADEDQGTAALSVFYKGLKWIFRDWRMPVETAGAGPDAIRAYYAGLSRKYGYEIPASEQALSVRGFSLIREQRFADAETIFRLNVEVHPASPQPLMNLAFLFERMKKREEAAAAYERAAEKAESAQPDLAKFCRAQAERLRKR